MAVVDQSTSFRAVRKEFRPTLRLALPLVFAEVGWMSMGIVDTILVGRLPDSAVAIGATGLGQSLFNSIVIFGAGLLLGLDTFVAQAYGRNDVEDARHSLVNGSFLALLLTPVLMFLVSLWPMLMRRFGVSMGLIVPMQPFLSALNWGALPLLAYFALRRYLQAVHVVHPIMFALISANVVNLVGDWALIYGHLGFPAMGIVGSGWSTSVARLYIGPSTPRYCRVRRVEARPAFLDQRGQSRFQARVGSPLVRHACRRPDFDGDPAFSAATALCAKLGPVPLSGHEIALNCAALTFMVPLGISSAAAVRVGLSIGQRGQKQGASCGMVCNPAGRRIHDFDGSYLCGTVKTDCWHLQSDPLVIQVGARLLLVAAAFQLFDGLQTVATGALRGSADTRTPMLANLIAYWFIGLPTGYVLCFRFGWGAVGIWIGLCIGLILIGSVLLLTRHRRLMPEVAEPVGA